MQKLHLLALLLMCLGFITPAKASDVPQSVIGTGGAEATGNNYQICGTVGQTVVGTTSSMSNLTLAGYWYNPGTTVTGIRGPDGRPMPSVFRLHQNYPNPFNPTTTIQFDLPTATYATIAVFDVAGRHVATLVDESVEAGVHRVAFNATGLASGVYFYRIEAAGYHEIRKLVLLK